jgi:hypothetical protein
MCRIYFSWTLTRCYDIWKYNECEAKHSKFSRNIIGNVHVTRYITTVFSILKINFAYMKRNFKKKFVVSSWLTGLCLVLTWSIVHYYSLTTQYDNTQILFNLNILDFLFVAWEALNHDNILLIINDIVIGCIHLKLSFFRLLVVNIYINLGK